MPVVTKDQMKALIRYGLEREGQTRLGHNIGRDLRQKRICIPEVGYDWNPETGVGTCFWFLINQPATGDQMVMREVGGFLLCHIKKLFGHMGGGPAFGGVVGNLVDTVHRAKEVRERCEVGVGLATGRRHEASESMKAANAASMAYGYHAAQGTDAETFMSLNYYQIGGVSAFISRPGRSRIVMLWNVCNDKNQFLSLYRYIEGRWRGNPKGMIPQVWEYAVPCTPRGMCLEGDGSHGEVAVWSADIPTYRNYERASQQRDDNLPRV